MLAENLQDLSARNTPINLLHVPRHSASSAAIVTVEQRTHTKKGHVLDSREKGVSLSVSTLSLHALKGGQTLLPLFLGPPGGG